MILTSTKILLAASIAVMFFTVGCSKNIDPEQLYIDPNRHFAAIYPKGWLPRVIIPTYRTLVEFNSPGVPPKPHIYLAADSREQQIVNNVTTHNISNKSMWVFKCGTNENTHLMTKASIEVEEGEVIKNPATRNHEQHFSFNYNGAKYGVGFIARKDMFKREYETYKKFVDNIILLEASQECTESMIKSGIVSIYY